MNLSRVYENRSCLGLMFLAACFLASFPVHGQSSAGSGQISGTVAGLHGSPVAGAQVVLRPASSSFEPRQTGTDSAGKYSFSALPMGAYKLSASASGFRGSEAKLVILTSANATVDLTLAPLEPGMEDSKGGSVSRKSPPAFSAAGVRGPIAPSGYASGLSEEETAHVRASANALGAMLFNTLTDAPLVDCSQEPALLRNVEKAPHDFASNHALGRFYLSHGDYSKALQYLGAAHSLVPGDYSNSRALAAAMIGGGHGSDGAALLETMLADHESDSSLWRLLAFAYRSSGEEEKSVAALQKAARMDAGADNQFGCGVGLIQLGALREALDLFTAGAKTHPESARLWLGLGIAEHLLDHKQEAVSSLLRSADADRDFFPPLAVLADLSGLPGPTQTDLRRRIAGYLVAHPGEAEAHFAYALVLSKPAPEESGALRQEISWQLKRALQLDPRMARAHFQLGVMATEADNLPGAVDAFVEVLKLEPGNAQAHYRLSLLYRRQGRQENARKEMDAFRALRGKPGEEGSADAAGSSFLSLPMIEPLLGQRGCGVEPD